MSNNSPSSMRAENKSVPKLRFPEFANSGEWEKATLGQEDVSSFVNEKIPIEGLRLETYISTENILPNYSGVTIASKLPPGGSFTQFREGDILISNIRPYLKKVWFSDMDGTASNDVIVVRAGSKLSAVFLSTILKNDAFISYVMKGAQGVKMPRGDKSLMQEYPILFPLKTEQQKIADCLSSLDDLLTAENQKLVELKAHKKGLMQNLFPAEGETVPMLRFKEFQGAWKQKLLGDMCDVLMCKRIFADETNGVTGVPFYKIGTLGGKPDSYISRELFEEYKTKYSYPKKGEILITCSGTVGKCIIYDGEDAYFQDSNIVWIDNSTLLISNEFLYYIISTVNWNILNSTTITRIYNADLKNLKIIFPEDTSEQLRIASLLSSIDLVILKQIDKIEMLRSHKKGLMQNLFPNF